MALILGSDNSTISGAYTFHTFQVWSWSVYGERRARGGSQSAVYEKHLIVLTEQVSEQLSVVGKKKSSREDSSLNATSVFFCVQIPKLSSLRPVLTRKYDVKTI